MPPEHRGPTPEGIGNNPPRITPSESQAEVVKPASSHIDVEDSIPFEQLQNEVRGAGVKNKTHYQREHKKHANWPSDPEAHYADEWPGWNVFLGKIVSIEELRRQALEAGIKDTIEYEAARKDHTGWPTLLRTAYGERYQSWNTLMKGYLYLKDFQKEIQAAGIRTEAEYKAEYPHHTGWPPDPREAYAYDWPGWDRVIGDQTSDAVDVLLGRLESLREDASSERPVTQEDKEHTTTQPAPAERVQFLVELYIQDPGAVSLDAIDTLLNNVSIDDVGSDRHALEGLLKNYIKLEIIKGRYDEAFRLFSRCTRQLSLGRSMMLDIYHTCLLTDCPDSEKEKYKNAVLATNTTLSNLQRLEERWMTQKTRGEMDSFRVAFPFKRAIKKVRQTQSGDVADDMVLFAQHYFPDFLHVTESVGGVLFELRSAIKITLEKFGKFDIRKDRWIAMRIELEDVRTRIVEFIEKNQGRSFRVLHEAEQLLNSFDHSLAKQSLHKLRQIIVRTPDETLEKIKERAIMFIEAHQNREAYILLDQTLETESVRLETILEPPPAQAVHSIGSGRQVKKENREQSVNDMARNIRALLKKGRITEAKELLTRALFLKPKSVKLYVIGFNQAVEEGDAEDAFHYLEQLYATVEDEDFYEELEERYLRRFTERSPRIRTNPIFGQIGSRKPVDKLASQVTGFSQLKKKE